MNGSPSAILTLGLGSWGSVGLVLSLGFGIGAAGFVLDTVCPLPVPAYARTNLSVPAYARDALPVPGYARDPLAVAPKGCRNEG